MVIHLISGPRNISTALMYSFAQRQDMVVMDEPFYGFYLRHTGIKHPGREKIIQSMASDPQEILDTIEANEQKKGHVFVKNMGHHLQGYDYSRIRNYENIFLIRDPKQMLISYAKVREQPTLDDIGLAYQAAVFAWLKENGHEPIVLNGNEVRSNPGDVLKKLCQKLGLPFDEHMLQWEAGPRPEDGIWAEHWYRNVHQSTGFSPPDAKDKHLPEELLPVYEEALPYYNLLNQYAIKADS
jgi:hypothetical protein